jgi:hypothetical protein
MHILPDLSANVRCTILVSLDAMILIANAETCSA